MAMVSSGTRSGGRARAASAAASGRAPAVRVRRLPRAPVGSLVLLELAAVCALLPWMSAGAWAAAGPLTACLLTAGAAPREGRPAYARWLAATARLTRRPAPVPPGTDPGIAPLAEWAPGLRIDEHLDTRGRRLGVAGDGLVVTAVLELTGSGCPLAGRPGALHTASVASAMNASGGGHPCEVRIVRHVRPRPSGADRGATWAAVSLDPVTQAEAVALRGGGPDGARRALVRAVDLLSARLAEAGVTARPLCASEVAAVLELSCAARSLEPWPPGPRTRESAGAWHCDGRRHAVFRVGGGAGLGPLCARAERLPARAVVLAMSLSPSGPGAVRITARIRLVCDDASGLATAARLLKRQARAQGVPLSRLDHAHAPGLLATVPLGGRP